MSSYLHLIHLHIHDTISINVYIIYMMHNLAINDHLRFTEINSEYSTICLECLQRPPAVKEY